MARGSAKFGGRGRDRDAVDTAPNPSDPGVSSAPSSARTILPGEPFEAAPAAFPSQRAADPLMPSGWGMPGLAGPGDGMGGPAFGPGGFATHDPAGFPEPATAPLPVLTPNASSGDPLDALQQYAGLPLSGFGGAAPAPDPTQLYNPAASFGPEAYGTAPAPGDVPAYGAAPVPDTTATVTEAAPAQPFPTTADPAPATDFVGYGAPSSGFAAGGIFTGGDDFSAATFGAAPPAPPAAGTPVAGTPAEATVEAGFGTLPGGLAEPLDVPPFGAAPAAPPVFGESATVLPGSPFDAPADEDPAQDVGASRSRRRRSGGKRAKRGTPEQPVADDALGLETFSSPARPSGSRRALAAVGVVAVLGGAGFLAYTQLSSTDTDLAVSTPVPSAGTASTRYALPAALGGLTQISPAQTQVMTERYTNLAKNSLPDLPAPLVVAGFQAAGSSTPSVNVVVYRANAQAEATLDALVGNLSRPAAGNASIAAVPTPGGAVGGSMLCGAQRGSNPTAWCAWRSAKGVGFVRALGTDNANYAAAYTRELRAFAER